MTTQPTVFIVDDDKRVRTALTRLMESVGWRVRAYAGARTFLAEYDPTWPGCLVLDVRMPEMSGLELQERLTAESEFQIPIIFITGHGDVPMSVRAMRAGAVDFLQKPFTDEVLIRAIRQALQRDEINRRQGVLRNRALERVARLTPREREVLEHVVAGKANKVIAIDLGASEKTIKIHRSRVMAKMEANSLPELVVLAQAAGIASAFAAPTG